MGALLDCWTESFQRRTLWSLEQGSGEESVRRNISLYSGGQGHLQSSSDRPGHVNSGGQD